MAATITAADITECRVERVEAAPDTVALALGGIRLGGRKGGLEGTLVVTAADGNELTLGCSKLDGETEWTVDALSVNGCPTYANGFGARYLATKVLANAELAAALDAEAGVIA